MEALPFIQVDSVVNLCHAILFLLTVLLTKIGLTDNKMGLTDKFQD